jgi:hypothetical protein
MAKRTLPWRGAQVLARQGDAEPMVEFYAYLGLGPTTEAHSLQRPARVGCDSTKRD